MEEKQTKKISLLRALAVELLILLLVFAALFWGEMRVAQRAAEKRLSEKTESITQAYVKSLYDSRSIIDLYDNSMQAKVNALAMLLDNTGKYDEDNIQSLCDTFGVEHIYLNDEWKANETELMIEYYSASLKDGRTVTIRQNIAEEEQLFQEVNFDSSLSENDRLSDLYIVYSSKVGIIIKWSGNDDSVNRIGDLGIDLNEISYNKAKWLTINGTRYYVLAREIPEYSDAGLAVLCGITYADVTGNSRIAAGIMCAFISMVFTVLVVYGFYNRQDEKKYKNDSATSAVRHKLAIFTVIGLILIGLGAYYIQSLYSLSTHVIEIQEEKESIISDLKGSDTRADNISDIHDRYYLTCARITSRILSDVPEARTKEDLSRLSEIFGLEYIMLFDGEGREILSDSDIFGFEISDDPESQSYPFSVLKHGVPYYIQQPMEEDLTKAFHQFIGVTMSDGNGNYDGFLQICISTEDLQAVREGVSLQNIMMSEMSQSGNGILCVSTSSNDITYYSRNNTLAQQKALNVGMSEEQLSGNYLGYIRVNNEKLFADSFEAADNYIYIVTPGDILFSGRITMTVFTVLMAIAAILVYTIWFRTKDVEEPVILNEDSPYLDVTTADGVKKRTLNIVARVFHIKADWINKPSEDKTRDIVRSVMLLTGFIFVLVFFARNRLYSENTFLGFITGNRWKKGINVFALTKSLLFIFNIYLLVSVLEYVLTRFIALSSPRNETIIRLLRSLMKYVAVLGTLYYVLTQFGFDSRSLLASAGLLTLIVGLGAKDLVTDILAGIFIIFENEFQVGDIIEVGGYKGRVVEIGIRTTRLINTVQDVKSINNRNLTNIVNKTKKNSYCDVIINVPFDQNIEDVEKLLKEDLPKLKETCPYIISGPYYGGIDDMSGRAMRMSIRTECLEEHKFEVRTEVNKEIKRLFEENGFKMI